MTHANAETESSALELMPAHRLPYWREAGSGPGVVCIHSNASTSSQWRPLMDRLSSRYRVLAPDSLGAGKSPAWPADHAVTLDDEVRLLEPVFASARNPFFLVGHSYGAAIALIAALTRPHRVRAIAVYEPTLFSLLEQEAPGQDAASGIRRVVADAAAAIAENQQSVAAERFIDYWMGRGTWTHMPEAPQRSIAAAMCNVKGWAEALFCDPTPLCAFASLDLPVLYMTGGRSPASSLGVARLLIKTLSDVEVLEFSDLGHMGPVTHPERVNEAIAEFFACN